MHTVVCISFISVNHNNSIRKSVMYGLYGSLLFEGRANLFPAATTINNGSSFSSSCSCDKRRSAFPNEEFKRCLAPLSNMESLRPRVLPLLFGRGAARKQFQFFHFISQARSCIFAFSHLCARCSASVAHASIVCIFICNDVERARL